jgi:hypothetical protein
MQASDKKRKAAGSEDTVSNPNANSPCGFGHLENDIPDGTDHRIIEKSSYHGKRLRMTTQVSTPEDDIDVPEVEDDFELSHSKSRMSYASRMSRTPRASSRFSPFKAGPAFTPINNRHTESQQSSPSPPPIVEDSETPEDQDCANLVVKMMTQLRPEWTGELEQELNPKAAGARYGQLTKGSPPGDIVNPKLPLTVEEWVTFFPQSMRRRDVCLFVISNPVAWGPSALAKFLNRARGVSDTNTRPTVNKWINFCLVEEFQGPYCFSDWASAFHDNGRRPVRSLPLTFQQDGANPTLELIARGVAHSPQEGEGRGVFSQVVEYAVAHPELGIRLSEARDVAILMGWYGDASMRQELRVSIDQAGMEDLATDETNNDDDDDDDNDEEEEVPDSDGE